ncbi:dolichyl-phosphate-mannose-protein mannosyltransferase [Rhodopseudomonas thermotolerans]|uniref:Dolichyl-phosphate-mannose-protein mannosyltransferase n=2 Tax=Rhodopseudomonas TaxID=1073 RepID=A0A336JS38_9BRAD|nr:MULTISPECIES: glycosyltransferase family 39 protein [Rhodopseudomonas]RED32628.1 dolichyl-phosphate-mannose-protein mannosyltransferase [Rhodopseudomonas pentothenatexigens]REF93637.1 dolichyl-phosphate-mannose-protein mannosyltransferase [Rhodopseudomonas thermotolerans]SSW91523.1 dolichyl-phosphate-mannose-protein mannosyltransferase [Rhodopseudomonas pentothenatexigens]
MEMLRNRPQRLLLWVLGLYGTLWFVSAVSFTGLPAVGYEMALFGNELQGGYWKYPPLAPWLTELASLATGRWNGAQLLLALGSALMTLALLWRLGAAIVGGTGATLAVALTILIGCFGPQVTAYDPAIASLPFGVAVVLLYRKAIFQEARSNWIALGVTSALLIAANHAGAALILVLAGHLLLTADGRRRLLSAGPGIAAAACFVVLLPHLMWLAQANTASAVPGDAAGPLWPRVGTAFAFVFGQVGLNLGLIVIAGLALIPRLPLQGEPAGLDLTAPSRFDRSLLLSVAVLPSLLVAIGSVFGWFSIGAYTGSALIAFSGLALVALLPAHLTIRAPRLAVAAWLLVLFGVPIGYATSTYSRAYGSGPVPTELYPARALSTAMQSVWKSRTTRPLDIVTGSTREAGFVAAYASPRPSVFIDADFAKSPWITPQRLKQSGTLVVWTTDEFSRTDVLPPPYRAALGDTPPLIGTMVLPLGGGKLKAYGWAMIAPEGVVVPAPASPTPPAQAAPPPPAPPTPVPALPPPPAAAPSAAAPAPAAPQPAAPTSASPIPAAEPSPAPAAPTTPAPTTPAPMPADERPSPAGPPPARPSQ